MAETLVIGHSGGGAEVVAGSKNQSWGWGSWKNSPSHYGILTSSGATVIGCGTVKVQVDYFNYWWWSTCQLA